MTGVGKVIYGLLNVQTINDLVGTRIYPVVAPNNASTFPCIVYEVESTEPINHKDRLEVQADGSKGRTMETVTIAIYCSGYEYSQVENLENQVRKLIDGFRGDVNGVCVDGVILENSSDSYNHDLEIFEKETIYNFRITY